MPSHLKARTYDTCALGPLTDERIFKLCLEGYYGDAKKRWAKDVLKNVKTAKQYAHRTSVPAKPSRTLQAAADKTLLDLGL